ncbi:ABC transporter ATP-binding protein [Arcanobacterium ihumii]
MNQLLLPRYKRLMDSDSWRKLFRGISWGTFSGAYQGFALLALLPTITCLESGQSSWGMTFRGWMITLAILAVLAVGTEFYGMRTSYVGTLGFIYSVHHKVGDKVSSLPLGEFDSGSAGRLSRIVTQEMINLGESAAHFIFSLARQISSAIIIVIGTWFWDWKLGFALTVSFLILIASLSLSRHVLNRGKQISEPTEAELASRMVEFATCQGALRSCNVASRYEALEKAFTNVYRKGRRSLWIETCGNLIHGTFTQLLIILLISVIATLATNGTITPLTAIATIGICLRFTTMLEDIGSNLMGLEERRQQMDHVDAIMDAEPLMEPSSSDALIAPGEVELDNVSFGYEPSHPVLNGISFQVPAGEMCALVGPSGCGKTTIARLIARFWDVQSGQVKVGGTDVKDQTIDDLMRQISFVFQDVYLFNDTLKENIRIGNPDASEEELQWAADLSGVTEIVRRLPDGWNSLAGAGGRALSGGERQRVSIARALLKQSPIVLFDEATSALDAENEANIVAAMDQLRKQSTLIVIAHKLETIKAADQIVVLSHDGHIAQQGTHSELVAQPGEYLHFWQERLNASGWTLV